MSAAVEQGMTAAFNAQSQALEAQSTKPAAAKTTEMSEEQKLEAMLDPSSATFQSQIANAGSQATQPKVPAQAPAVPAQANTTDTASQGLLVDVIFNNSQSAQPAQ